jgi:hydroxyacylglutathione hydrolase
MTTELAIIPVRVDNYTYALHDRDSGTTLVIDPGEAEATADVLRCRGWRLTHLLNTHHHDDHCAGNATLKAQSGAPLIGPRAEIARIPDIDIPCVEGQTLVMGGLKALALETPGHTRGHMAFFFEEQQLLFSGDALFSMGCGRLFEGTPEQMWNSLLKLRALPDETRLCCGHEYTQSNARFALSLEPERTALLRRAAEVDLLRARGAASLPVTLGEEKQTNPFLRADDPALAERLGMAGASAVEIFARLRRDKDHFKA